MIRAAVYARKSTDDERRDGKSESVERQIVNARAYAAKQGWTVADAHAFSDANISGGDFERTGLNAMLAALKAKQPPFERLVVMEQSRLGRDVARTMLLIEAIEDAGVQIVSYADGRPITLHDESGENAVALRGIIDNSEKRRARGRTREGMAERASEGHVTGAVAFGYRGNRVADEYTEYVINEEQAEVVRLVYALFADGNGCGRIVNKLRERGAPAPGIHGWSKNTVRAMLNRPIYVGVIETKCSTGDAKYRKQENVIRKERPELRIIPVELEQRVRERQAQTRATLIRGERGHLDGKPETSVVSKYLCNTICRCHVCGGPLIYWNKGRRHRAAYYCSNRIHRGAAVCSNASNVPLDGLDYAITTKLAHMLNEDFDKIVSLCMEQQQVWREKQAMPKGQRTQLEREQKRLESAINRLLDQIEAGQAVGDRLKKRQEELDIIKAKLDLADMPEVSRDTLAAMIAPYGPLIGLGMGDVATMRQILKKCGITSIVVTPEGPGAWRFEGQADFSGVLHRRSSAPPPDGPPPAARSVQ